MMILIGFTLLCYGLSNVLVYGSIFEGLRNNLKRLGEGPKSLHKLFSCMMCMPTWVGFIISTILQLNGWPTPFTEYGVDSLGWAIFFDGLLASGAVYAFNVLVEHFEGE